MQKTMIHINNILSAIDDPKTLKDIQDTASSISSISAKIDGLSSDLSEILNNDDFMNAIKNAAIGIGKLFDDIYQ